MKKSFNIQELQHHKFNHETKLMHPSSSRAFQRHEECNVKHPSLVDFISTKQNKQIIIKTMIVAVRVLQQCGW